MCICVCLWVCAYEYRSLQRLEEDIGSLETGVTGCCEPPSVSARNRIQVLCKSTVCSELLSCPSLQPLLGMLGDEREEWERLNYTISKSISYSHSDACLLTSWSILSRVGEMCCASILFLWNEICRSTERPGFLLTSYLGSDKHWAVIRQPQTSPQRLSILTD